MLTYCISAYLYPWTTDTGGDSKWVTDLFDESGTDAPRLS